MSAATIREATTDTDRAAAFRFRYELYVEDQGLFADAADHQHRFLRDAEDERASIWLVEHGGEVVGTGRLVWGRGPEDERDPFVDLVPDAEIAMVSRILIAPEHRRGRVLYDLVLAMFVAACARGCQLVLAECEPHLVNTWLKVGLRIYGLREHPSNGTLVRMALVLADREHAERCESPLLAVSDSFLPPSANTAALAGRLGQCPSVASEMADPETFAARLEQTLPATKLRKLLGGVDRETLDTLLRGSLLLECDADTRLIRWGHVSRTVYVLLEGSLLVRDEERTLAEVEGQGELLGEVAFFAGRSRLAEVAAGSRGATVLALNERSLSRLIAKGGRGAMRFVLNVTRAVCLKLHERAEAAQLAEPAA